MEFALLLALNLLPEVHSKEMITAVKITFYSLNLNLIGKDIIVSDITTFFFFRELSVSGQLGRE